MGMAGRYFFVREFVSSFSKNKEGKASDIRKIHGSHKRYPWKGNVRELKNTEKRCLVVTEGEILDYQSLPLQMLELSENTGNNIGLNLASVEKHHIQKVLQHTNGYKLEAARLLGIGLTTLYRKMETYGLFLKALCSCIPDRLPVLGSLSFYVPFQNEKAKPIYPPY